MATRKSTSTGYSLTEESLGDFGIRNMGIYATEVNLSRSVPDLIDGLKPVQRRILWEAYQQRGSFIKTARLSGGVIGKWHPHGDASVNQAVETLVHHPTPTMLGSGNWGGLLDPAAAARYTNCRLSNYGESFFLANYINKEVTSFVPNYDDTEVEPVSLPSLLPNVLLNGGEGIGVGVTTNIPTFTPESVIEVLVRLFNGEKLQVVDFAKTLKFHHKWGGEVLKTKENKANWLQLFKSSTASIQFQAQIHVDRDTKSLEIDDWPPGLNPESFVNKVRAFPETDQVFNHKGDTGFKIEMRKDHNYTQFDKYVEKIQKLCITRKSYRINVTHRKAKTVEGKTTFETKFLAVSVPKLLLFWCRERLELEKKSLAFRLKKQEEVIAYSKLLIFASTKLDVIFKALRAPDSKSYLVKNLKITEDQANLILDLKVRQLSKLDQDSLKNKLKEQEAMKKTLLGWVKNPKGKIAKDFSLILESIEKDRKFELAKSKEVKVS